MAVLGKIRQHSIVLIVVIALALFSFVLMDVLQSGTFSSNANAMGSINGTEVDGQQFMRRVAQMEQQNPNISNTQAMNSVWEQEVRKVIMDEAIEKSGLGLGDDQVINEIKKNPYFAQNPQFLNEAGVFDEAKFKEFVISIQNDPNKERWNEWKNFENEITSSSVQQMYYNLVKGSVFTTKSEGQFKHVIENRKVDFNYVTVPYSTINDDEVKVSDDEILAYMKKYPKKYKSDATRSIEYVYFENKPSEADTKEREAAMDKIVYGTVAFNSATNSNDTIPAFKDMKLANLGEFVNANSDIKFDSTYLTKKELPLDYQEQLFNLSVGEVFGPYVFNEHQCVSRVVDKKANASARASHILVSYAGAPNATVTRTKEEAQAKANDLLAQAKANPNGFAALATANTDDPGSKTTGGEYDNITQGQMVPEFNDFVFNSPVGTIGIVETTYGFHIIKVSEKYNSVLLATVAQSIEPSEATIDANFTASSKFEADANEKDFTEVAKAKTIEVIPANNVKAIDENIGTLGKQREIVRWLFNADTKKGDISRFETPEGFVVAKVTTINETGLLSLDIAKESVGKILINEKKAAKIHEKMKGATLEEVAKATGGTVATASNVSVQLPTIPNIGQEPKVVGTAFDLEAGKVSSLIDGAMGVYMIKPVKVTPEAKITNFTNQINAENQQQVNSAQNRIYQALKEKAEIEDKRGNM